LVEKRFRSSIEAAIQGGGVDPVQSSKTPSVVTGIAVREPPVFRYSQLLA
jgi:hypothetical protein